MIIENFIKTVIEKYKTGHAIEHAYRPALEELFAQITGLNIINDPKRSQNGAPDFVFLNKKTVVAYAEAKDITESLSETEKTDQMTRYYGYSNLILTNCLEFRFYRNGQNYGEPIKIAELKNKEIITNENNYILLHDTIRDFIKESKEPIKSGGILAKVMAGKARRIRDNVSRFLEDKTSNRNDNLLDVFKIIKELLLNDLDEVKFADMYAQTLVYGLFVARYYDETPDNFSRQEARDLVPASNPFLRHFFDHIAGSSFDPRIEFIVNELCEEFVHADIKAIIHDYYKVEKDDSRDPIIHFYEDFLQEYDPEESKKMGVFYTPLPVVRFIVRAVDDVLKKEFGLEKGIADSSKIEIEKEIQGKKKKDLVHKVQVLDPATGTGTFLNETILHIKKSFEGQRGRWQSYVNEDLLPRLHGFELMMASYTIAHLKLSSTILETGATIENTRLGIYLTNSLEKGEVEERTLFSLGLGKAISEESNQANKVKNELPIMVVIGNPPYSGISSNETEYANSLVDKYKIEPGGLQKLQERKHWLNDDYVKFIAFAEDMIIKNGEGVIGFITNHGYLDNPTFRGMRWHLRNTFDLIYILDLHGNSNKKETNPDGGSKDENVFDIKTGVSIILAVKKNDSKNKQLAKIYKADFYGLREEKFKKLDISTIDKVSWTQLSESTDIWIFEGKGKPEYMKGFSVAELFPTRNTGVCSQRDEIAIQESREKLQSILNDFSNLNEQEIRHKYKLKKDGRDWTVKTAKEDVIDHNTDYSFIKKIDYRPFDTRYTFFTRKSKGFVAYPRGDVFKHLEKDNISILINKAVKNKTGFHHIFVSKNLPDLHLFETANASIYASPLYLYAEDGTKVPNLKKEIVSEIEKIVGKTTPEDILDYIYAILHSPNYREKYKEFLKIDFPRVPYPPDKGIFLKLVEFGKELRELHLLESPKINKFVTTFSEKGTDIIEKAYPKYKNGNVFINEKQYFGNVPEIAWKFYIGGYQPAQKWLKDRQGRKLLNEDIEHYQKIVIVLFETDRIMKEIDKIYGVSSKKR